MTNMRTHKSSQLRMLGGLGIDSWGFGRRLVVPGLKRVAKNLKVILGCFAGANEGNALKHSSKS